MPENPAPVAIVEAYHRAWTSGDVDRAMTYVADSFVCSAPDPDVTTKEHWRGYLSAFMPMLTGTPELTRMTEGKRVALWYYPQTAVTENTLASELFTVEGGRITSIHLTFDRLGYRPPQAA
ncbi:nuclear transport factor 2 family protein [Microbacterium sp. DT81.1]|uniref:nuclear transport factor 2 family protein n=1 Tax=Microbacterium sp. DT81.1 TaxID=3393413 RepID=UPI003CE6A961